MSNINPLTIIVLAALVGVLAALIYARRKSASNGTTDPDESGEAAGTGRVTAQGAGGTGPFRPKNGTK